MIYHTRMIESFAHANARMIRMVHSMYSSICVPHCASFIVITYHSFKTPQPSHFQLNKVIFLMSLQNGMWIVNMSIESPRLGLRFSSFRHDVASPRLSVNHQCWALAATTRTIVVKSFRGVVDDFLFFPHSFLFVGEQ